MSVPAYSTWWFGGSPKVHAEVPSATTAEPIAGSKAAVYSRPSGPRASPAHPDAAVVVSSGHVTSNPSRNVNPVPSWAAVNAVPMQMFVFQVVPYNAPSRPASSAEAGA